MRPKTREGTRFGRLVVVAQYEKSEKTDGNHKYLCKCDCGNTKVIRWRNLRRGETKSCGCLYQETLTALKQLGEDNRKAKEAARAEKASAPRVTGHPLYSTWKKMRARCYDRNHHNYRFYGGRGISVCGRWLNDFLTFVADMGPKPSKQHTLDRVDPDGDYAPGNCRWATKLEQCSNIRNVDHVYVATLRGKTRFVTDWAKQLGFNPDTAKQMIRDGDAPELAVLTALMRRKEWERTGGHGANYEKCRREAEEWLEKNQNP